MRLRVHVEGQTEEAFVNRLLAPYLGERGFESVDARLIGSARQRAKRGGVRPWASFRNELIRHLESDRHILHTSMVDFYGMPAEGNRAWPGRKQAAEMSQDRKGQHVAEQMLADLHKVRPGERRFVPFVTMHEYEALLFSDCDAFARALDRPELAESLQGIRDRFASPEHINDAAHTAPSKRILALHPSYAKVAEGTAAAEAVTVTRMTESAFCRLATSAGGSSDACLTGRRTCPRAHRSLGGSRCGPEARAPGIRLQCMLTPSAKVL